MITKTHRDFKDDVEKLNVYSIFEAYVDNMIDAWMATASPAELRKIHRRPNTILHVHHMIALQYLFWEVEIIDCDYYKHIWTNELISQLGLIYFKDGLALFLHETFAELFVADFVAIHLKAKPNEVISLLLIILTSKEHQSIRVFLDKALTLSDFTQDEKRVIAMLMEKNIWSQPLLFNVLQEGLENLAVLLLDCMSLMNKTVTKMILVNFRNFNSLHLAFMYCSQ